MELTMITEWLNSVFTNFDYSILSALHHFAERTNGLFTMFFSFVSLFAENGICMLLLGIVLMCFKKTRKIGMCVFGAVCCGIVITNLVLKDFIARPRPFADAAGLYNSWWRVIGMPAESRYSFPSGHVTAAMAAMTALFFSCRKKTSWIGFLFVALMGLSRNYLMVHYPSDVLGGVVAGAISAVIAFYITKLIYHIFNKYSENRLCRLFLQFDISDILHRNKNK